MTQFPSSPLARTTAGQSPAVTEVAKAIADKTSDSIGPNNGSTQQTVAHDASRKDTLSSEQTNSALTNESSQSGSSSQNQSSPQVAFPSTSVDRRENATEKPLDRPQSPENRRRDSGSPGTNEVGVQERKVSGAIERTESVVSRSSIVASMRDKWGRGVSA